MPAAATAPALARPAREVLDDLRRAWGEDVRVWARAGDAWRVVMGSEADGATAPGAATAEVPGTEYRLELPGADPAATEGAARFLASTLARVLRHDDEIRSFSREISERYEEINLLYSISEILGSIISLEQAAGTIITEVASILGASRAALWVHDAERNQLALAAVEGGDGFVGPIAVDDRCSVTASVFREGRPIILAPGEMWARAECGTEQQPQQGAFLSVPVSYTPPEGEPRTVGVINLTGRPGGFSAGDLKLLAAIASQIGAAVENNRLIEESLRQERIVREMELAHDLQLKLLPPLEQFANYAEVAARCVPAESVGGDFYHLFRLPGNRLGVLIGDVSSHGFGAALIMALTMSAVAIHASEGDPPAEVLRRTHLALIDELETTEMYLTLFYGVIDPAENTIVYANAGHSHAWRIPRDGDPQRLNVTDPPFGIIDRSQYGEATAPWIGGTDILFLFTDGLSDALGKGEVEGEKVLVDEVARRRTEPTDEIVRRLFSRIGEAGSVPPDDRTAVVLRF
ncbi:PP2C family protein-serine/threonine phosphatase [Longimicrobium sp.]|uniref:PP2C family protein-serine/threonine phosphatase n=1 Tax=Longimicrobium sp. TaxID=2029185 RepID=UPI002C010827|nr:SpoIIE family protein phosphatase [Longimicrobium sp.]HSU13962.1 SpoIIE family protein phosphatase [Longimicrobium sp.]